MKISSRVYAVLALIVCGGAVHAEAPYGLLTGAVKDTTRSTYAMDFLLSRRAIRYAVSDSVSPEEEQVFVESIKKWPREVAKLIKESQRTGEFQDALLIFNRKMTLVRVSDAQEADVYFEITPHPNCDGAIACFREKGALPYARILLAEQARTDFEKPLLHEIGHYYGLGDQYPKGRLNNHEEYSGPVNREEKSIMQGSHVTDGQITCDDADGMINLLDLLRAKRNNNRFTWRANKGWASLCASSNSVYKKARDINRRADAFFQDIDSWTSMTSLEFKDGYLVRKVRASISSPLQIFAIAPQDKVTRDPETNLVTEVESGLKGLIIFPQREEWKETELTWKRQFSYQPAGADSQQIAVHIDEWLNGEKMSEREMTLSADGTLLGNPNFSLSPESLSAKTATYTLSLELKNRKIVKFSMKGNSSHFVLTGTPDKEIRYSEDNGQTFTPYTLPLTDFHLPPMLIHFFDGYQNLAAHLMSFYKNFHEPLFRPRGEQITSKLKNGLQN